MAGRTTKHGRRGFTLAELVVSVAITTVIGSAVVGLAMALSTASEHGRDRYLSLQTARITMLRLQDKIRKAKLVTAANRATIVLWAEDANNNGRINLSEIMLVGLAPRAGEIWTRRIVFPEYWSEQMKAWLDIELKLDAVTDVKKVVSLLKESSYQEITVLAGDVTNFNVSVSPTSPMTELVGLSMTVGSGPHAVTLRSAAHPRTGATDLVGVADGKYVLMTGDEQYLLNNEGL